MFHVKRCAQLGRLKLLKTLVDFAEWTVQPSVPSGELKKLLEPVRTRPWRGA